MSGIKDKAVQILTAMENGETATLAECFSAHAEFWPPISAQTQSGIDRPVRGSEAIASLFTSKRSFKSMHMDVEHCLSDGSFVTVHVRMHGVTRSDREYDAQHLWLFRFDGERADAAWEYADTAYFLDQMRAQEDIQTRIE